MESTVTQVLKLTRVDNFKDVGHLVENVWARYFMLKCTTDPIRLFN